MPEKEAVSIKETKRHLRLGELVAISAYWFGTNVHWTALLLILLPAQVALMAKENQASALGLVIGAGAIMPLFVPLIVGPLSDRCSSRWGRRRPYIFWGTLINLVGLVGLFKAGSARDLPLSIVAYLVV